MHVSLLCVAMTLINTLCLSMFDIYMEIIRCGDLIKSIIRDRGHSPVPVHSEYCGYSHIPFAAAIAHPFILFTFEVMVIKLILEFSTLSK